MSLPELADCADYQTLTTIKIKKRKKPPGSDNITPHHTNKIAKTCIPEDMNIDVEKEVFNDALSHHSNKVARPPTLYNNECVHVAKSARINVSDTKSWIPRRSDSLSSDSSYDEDNPTENDDDDDENNSSLEEDGSNDEEIQSITALFRVMKLLGTLAQIRPNDDEVQKIISSLEGSSSWLQYEFNAPRFN